MGFLGRLAIVHPFLDELFALAFLDELFALAIPDR
jgi:hypothetical protein